jgi:membrane protease YdiL (CAAX protease family)
MVTDASDQQVEQISLWKQIVLHLMPGVLAVALFVLLNELLPAGRLPAILILQICLVVALVAELGIVLLIAKKQTGKASIAKAIRFTSKLKWWQLILFSSLSIVWVAVVFFAIGDAVNQFVLSTFFDWLPDYFQITEIFENPALYPRGMRISIWASALLFGSLLGPLVEELYFRGTLLPRMKVVGWLAPFVGSLLFVVYHFWSPWMIPIRLLAILPMVYFVWWKKNIYIGVIAHCTLNLVSDAILTIPIYFS